MYTLARADSDKSDPGRAAGRLNTSRLNLLLQIHGIPTFARSLHCFFFRVYYTIIHCSSSSSVTNPGPGETGAKVDSEYQPK